MGDAHLSCFLLSAPQGFVARGRKEPIFQGTQAQSDGHARQQALRAFFEPGTLHLKVVLYLLQRWQVQLFILLHR
jgi:hypothetical protein